MLERPKVRNFSFKTLDTKNEINEDNKKHLQTLLKKCSTEIITSNMNNINGTFTIGNNSEIEANFKGNSKIENSFEALNENKFKETIDLTFPITSRYLDETEEHCDVHRVLTLKPPNINFEYLENPSKFPKINNKNSLLTHTTTNQLEFVNNEKFGNNINLNINKDLLMNPSENTNTSNSLNRVELENRKKPSKSSSNNSNIVDDDRIKQMRLNELRKSHTQKSLLSNNNVVTVSKNNHSEKSKSDSSSFSDFNNDNDDSSNYSGASSCSDFAIVDIKTFTGEFYTLSKLERKIFPKELDVFNMLNRNTTNDMDDIVNRQRTSNYNTSTSENFLKDRENHNAKDDLKKRKGKLLQKNLLIYVSPDSEQQLFNLELNDCYLELGSKYKINSKSHNNKCNDLPNTLYSFNIWKNQHIYAFYVSNEEERNNWVKEINDVIGSNEITNNYFFTKIIYNNPKKLLTVKRARRKVDGKLLAVKVFEKNEGNSIHTEFLNSVWKDVSIINALNHPYVIKIYDKVENKDSINLVFEYCSGGTLYDYLERREFIISEKVACRIIFQICCVVGYLHTYNVLHRNLNLENFLMTNDTDTAEIRLISFSNSKYLKSGEACMEYSGLLNYAAPEILLENPYNFSSDIWSIGVISYILLSGSYPFNESDQSKLFLDITLNNDIFPDKLWKYCSKESIFFVKNLMHKNPSKRMNFVEIFEFSWFYIWGNQNI